MNEPADQEHSVSSRQAHFQDEKYPPQVHPDGRVTFRLLAPRHVPRTADLEEMST